MSNFHPVKYKETERELYSLTAESYAKYGRVAFESLAVPLLEGLNLKPGENVLDVACGIGIPSLNVAPLVAPGGSVTGVDLAPGMVEYARQRASAIGIRNVSFQEADAENLPFSDNTFDTVICHMGLIHFTDRVKALGEMDRVLKPGGRLAISVWASPDKVPTLSIIAKAIATLWPAAIVPGAPNWFDLGSEDVLEKILTSLGPKEVRVARFNVPMEIKNGEEYWQIVFGVSGRLQMLLKSIPPDIASKIESQAKDDAEKFRQGELIRIPCEELIAWARKI